MQSFLAKYPDKHEKQVILDGNFLIIIEKFLSAKEVSDGYKLAKSEAKEKKAEIKHLFEKRTIVNKIKHKITRKYFRRIRVMGLPFYLSKKDNLNRDSR